MKKAQMEIIGLVIIVILITIGMFFIIKYNLKQETSSSEDYGDQKLASNFISVLRDTTVDVCYDNTFEELYQDCAAGRDILCENGVSYCEYIKIKTKDLLDKSFGKINKKYHFKSYINEDQPFLEFGDECYEREGRDAPIPLKTGVDVHISLYICK